MKFTCLLTFLFLFGGCVDSPKQQVKETMDAVALFDSPTGEHAGLPHLFKGGDENLYMSWVETEGDKATLKFSQLQGDQWSEPEVIASGDNWFINWADYPIMAVDSAGNMIAHFPAKSGPDTYAYDVNVVIKPTGAADWSEPFVLHGDGTQTEHGFVSMLPQNDGSFRVTWLDGRHTGGSEGDHDHGGDGAMTLRTALVNLEGEIVEETELDHRVCDCCQTGMARSTTTEYVVYRDRSEHEIRDMYFVSNTGLGWSKPERIAEDNWHIAGCPVNGPRIASYEDALAVAWFTAADGEPKVKLAFSADGISFEEPILIDNTQPLGRLDIVMLDQNTAVISWLDNDDSTMIRYRMVKRSGEMSPAQVVAMTSESRSSGFPQMELLNGALYFAWTVSDGEEFRIEMARIAI